MQGLDIAFDFDTKPTINVSDNQNNTFLNMRILYFLQELNSNMAPTLQDFINLMDKYDQPSS